jgi:N utilization substance protein B
MSSIIDYIPYERREITSLSKAEVRSLTLHILYTLESHNYACSLHDVVFDYAVHYKVAIEINDECIRNIESIIENRSKLDLEIKPFLKNWKIDRLSIMIILILRYAIWEMLIKNADYALVINEAVELAKGFAEKDSYKFVNGLLDSWVKEKRKV